MAHNDYTCGDTSCNGKYSTTPIYPRFYHGHHCLFHVCHLCMENAEVCRTRGEAGSGESGDRVRKSSSRSAKLTDNKCGGNEMLKLLKILLSVTVIVLGSYSLITKNFNSMPFMLFVLGTLFLITGSAELKAKRRTNGIISLIAAAWLLFVAIYTVD